MPHAARTQPCAQGRSDRRPPGAAGVALWFFAIDLLNGQPLYTPNVLGETLLNVLRRDSHYAVVTNVGAYTLFHAVAFVAVGTLASALLEASRRVPHLGVGLALLFVVFEVGFYGLTALISQSVLLGALAWYQIGAANLVASALMGSYLWRRHPEFAPSLAHALDGSL